MYSAKPDNFMCREIWRRWTKGKHCCGAMQRRKELASRAV
jgi:hypothetical protein